MIRAALVLLMLGGCAHIDREPSGQGGARPHFTLVLCMFASCHHIAHPDGGGCPPAP